jgi:hypothetical protein
MKSIALAAALSVFALSSPALAQGSGTCATKAVSAEGKALSGAAKNSFVKKCKEDTCASKAVDKNGKALAGAAKASFMKKCEASA